jgi:hypothetical protein
LIRRHAQSSIRIQEPPAKCRRSVPSPRVAPHLRTCLRGLAARCARVLIGFTLENGRAQGMPGARGLVRNGEVGCAHEHTGSAEASGIPCVMALRLMPCSPRRRIRLVTVVGGCCDSSTPVGFELVTADLAPATGVRTTRFCRTLKRRSSCAPANRSRGSTRPATRICAPTLSRPPHPIPRS